MKKGQRFYALKGQNLRQQKQQEQKQCISKDEMQTNLVSLLFSPAVFRPRWKGSLAFVVD